MRLDKFLADMGVGSRSDLKKAIRKSLVTVNGAVEKDPVPEVSEYVMLDLMVEAGK